MGGDGGSIPKRAELVKTRTKPEQASRTAELVAKWRHCAITQQPLLPPIVACELGRLYNKEAVLEFLLDKSKLECAANFSHIRGLKDIKELKLTTNPAFTSDASKSGNDRAVCQYICPVSGLEMNGRHRFCYFLSCGCVFSDRALREIKDSTCVNCGKSYVDDDIIIINGTDEEIHNLQARMDQRRLQARASKKRKAAPDPSTDTTGEAAAAAGTKATKLAAPVASAGASSSKQLSAGKPKTIQEDPKASEVFKSLFNTHKTAKQQTKAHWVTYNPQYF